MNKYMSTYIKNYFLKSPFKIEYLDYLARLVYWKTPNSIINSIGANK